MTLSSECVCVFQFPSRGAEQSLPLPQVHCLATAREHCYCCHQERQGTGSTTRVLHANALNCGCLPAAPRQQRRVHAAQAGGRPGPRHRAGASLCLPTSPGRPPTPVCAQERPPIPRSRHSAVRLASLLCELGHRVVSAAVRRVRAHAHPEHARICGAQNFGQLLRPFALASGNQTAAGPSGAPDAAVAAAVAPPVAAVSNIGAFATEAGVRETLDTVQEAGACLLVQHLRYAVHARARTSPLIAPRWRCPGCRWWWWTRAGSAAWSATWPRPRACSTSGGRCPTRAPLLRQS